MFTKRSEDIKRLLEAADSPEVRAQLTIQLEISASLNEAANAIASSERATAALANDIQNLRGTLQDHMSRESSVVNRLSGAWWASTIIFPVLLVGTTWYFEHHVVAEIDGLHTRAGQFGERLLTLEGEVRFYRQQTTENGERIRKLEESRK